jgi:hypothetical protein
MYYMDDEDYFGPSEFDVKIEELKNELRESVKKEVKDELEKLREENKKLQGIKENFESIKKDYGRKKAECESAMRNAETKARQARLKELMEQFKVVLWSVKRNFQYKEKCDRCDSDREVKIKLPSGRMTYDDCKCGTRKKVYYPDMEILYELSDEYQGIKTWYRAANDKEESDLTMCSCTTYVEEIVDHNKDFNEIDAEDNIFFATKEECQEFCDYMNRKEENSGYDYDLAGKLIKAREV